MKVVEITYRYSAEPEAVRPQPIDATAARQRLDDGNRSFAMLMDGLTSSDAPPRCVIPVNAEDLGLLEEDREAPPHKPFAAVLGCSDARVPIEFIFNEGPNDLFVVRVAGNGLGNEVLGSLKYAATQLDGSLKLAVVLGHSRCGAVSAAVDVFLQPNRYLAYATDHALRGILDRLLIVVQASAKAMQESHGAGIATHSNYRETLIEVSVGVNAALAAYTLQQEIDRRGSGDLRAVYGVYVLEGRRVWAPRTNGGEWSGLADPPADPGAFAALRDAFLQSERIAALLKEPD
jgi:carbonic anhydrase